MSDWLKRDEQYLMHTYQRYPLTIERAKGNYLYDSKGEAYLDLFTGLAVNTLGHGHPRLLKALQQQAENYLHLSNFFPNPPAIRLAEQLVTHTLQEGKVFFTNSGAEASEALIKLVHKWSNLHEYSRDGIVVLKNSFHGRTLGALRLTRQASVYQDFPSPSFPVYEVDAEQPEELLTICEQHKPAAILMEPILGSGGVISLSTEYLQFVQTTAQAHNMLFCIDEIQTGMGRTGTLFAYQAHELTPDCILFAKGIGGGLPLGGIIVKEAIANSFRPGDHGSTFAPSPVSAALGNAVFDALLIDQLLEQGKAAADLLWSQLRQAEREFPHFIKRIDGRGMMIGIHTHLTPEQTLKIQRQLLQKRFLVNVTAKTVIRLLPPLTLQKAEIDAFVHALKQQLEAIS